jgi:CBS domain-containing protein
MVRDVVTIKPSASLADAAKRMLDSNVGILPVVESGRVLGVITDRDLVVRALARTGDLGSMAVSDCATSDPVVAHPDWNVDQAMETMAQAQIGRLPVVDDRNALAGIVTLSSLALRSRKDRETLETAKEVSRRSEKSDSGEAGGAGGSARRG